MGTDGSAAIWHLAWALAVAVMGGVLSWHGALAPGPSPALGAIAVAALFGAALPPPRPAGRSPVSSPPGLGRRHRRRAAASPAALRVRWRSGGLAPLAAGAAFGRPRLMALGAAAGDGRGGRWRPWPRSSWSSQSGGGPFGLVRLARAWNDRSWASPPARAPFRAGCAATPWPLATKRRLDLREALERQPLLFLSSILADASSRPSVGPTGRSRHRDLKDRYFAGR